MPSSPSPSSPPKASSSTSLVPRRPSTSTSSRHLAPIPRHPPSRPRGALVPTSEVELTPEFIAAVQQITRATNETMFSEWSRRAKLEVSQHLMTEIPQFSAAATQQIMNSEKLRDAIADRVDQVMSDHTQLIQTSMSDVRSEVHTLQTSNQENKASMEQMLSMLKEMQLQQREMVSRLSVSPQAPPPPPVPSASTSPTSVPPRDLNLTSSDLASVPSASSSPNLLDLGGLFAHVAAASSTPSGERSTTTSPISTKLSPLDVRGTALPPWRKSSI